VIVSPTWAGMFGGLKARTPVPPTTILWSRLEGTELVDVGAVDDVAVGGAEAEAEAEAGVLPVAAAWKAANLSPGLIAKTMPALQWVPCRQYAQIGVVRCTVSSATGKLLVTASATGMLQMKKKVQDVALTPSLRMKLAYNPVSKPPAKGVQGLCKVDCVTVWFFWRKINRTTSPTFAF